jgi:hypothetical protein
MRGRVAAVFFLLLSFSLESGGQCSYEPRYSGQFRSTVYDVAVDGAFVWTATGYGVQLFEANEVIDAVALPGDTRAIVAGANGLAYAGSGTKLVVLRRNGQSIEVVRTIDAPGAINDLLITTHLFAATRNGIAHYDLVDPTTPMRTSAVLTTSRANVTSLSLARDQLYAADGDLTVEIFNVSIPSLPQRTGALEALPRSGAVHATAEGLVFVSDDIGLSTDVFGGTSRITRVPYGSTSFAAATGGAIFVAGNDRTLRALSLADPTRIAELYERQLAPTGGTANGIFELVRSGNTLYVAAGDLGLLTFDVSSLVPPYPLLSYGGIPTSSALIIEGSVPKAYFGDAHGTITETSLELATLRESFDPGVTRVIHDSRGSDLLISSGTKVSLLSFGAPATLEFTFPANVTQAAILTDTIVALLANQSVWTVKATAGSTPEAVDLGGAKISHLARS